MKRFLFFIIIFSFFSNLITDNSTPGNYTIIPYAGYNNESKIILGSFANFEYRLKKRPVNTRLSFNVSQKKQASINLQNDFSVYENSVFAKLDLKYRKWPDKFYGVGIATDSNLYDNFTHESIGFDLDLMYSKNNFFAGIDIDVNKHNMIDWQDEGFYFSIYPDLSCPSLEIGIGTVFGFDSRDNRTFTTKGLLLEGRVQPIFKANLIFNYLKLRFDLRYFTSISEKQIIAMQVYSELNSERANFLSLPRLGNYLRAYESLRYIDSNIIALRLEYKVFPFDLNFLNRFGLVSFTELGSVSPSFKFLNYKYSLGLGVRYRLNEKSHTHLRMDFAQGKNSKNIIMIGVEAF